MTADCQHPFGFRVVEDLGEIIMILDLHRAVRIVPRLDRHHESRRSYRLFIANERTSAQGESQAKLIMPSRINWNMVDAFLEFCEFLVMRKDHRQEQRHFLDG
jgi:hypothetical protein